MLWIDFFKHTLFDRLSKNAACWGHREGEKQNESGFPKASHSSGEIYDQAGKKHTEYQELVELSKPTLYETLT